MENHEQSVRVSSHMTSIFDAAGGMVGETGALAVQGLLESISKPSEGVVATILIQRSIASSLRERRRALRYARRLRISRSVSL